MTVANTSTAELAGGAAFKERLAELVLALCALDTTPHADVARSARAESAAFDLIAREAESAGLAGIEIRRVPIDPRIADHPFFTPLYYTQSAAAPAGLDAARAYAGRANLIVRVPGAGGEGGPGVKQAFNVHVDVVRPFFPPTRDGDIILSRGACDDKGNVAALLGGLRIIGQRLRQRNARLQRDLVCMFVIDEETGGNGSLSCALDRDLKNHYDSLFVLECTGSRLHPGNRGCVWYRIDGSVPGVNLFEAAAFILAELEDEGRAIRAESRHGLYPHRPVQTCHGIIGNCGEHPSRINGEVSFRIGFASAEAARRVVDLVGDVLADGLRTYVGLYGDKAAERDANGVPRLAQHYHMTADGADLVVRVFGLTGHMSAIRENDGAITKMAALVRALVRSRAALAQAADSPLALSLAGWAESDRLVLEGGQGFVPTHRLEDIQQRVRAAVQRGLRRYLDIAGAGPVADDLPVTFEKLHNAAFARPVESADVAHALAAGREAGLDVNAPLVGWDASCDARIFAWEYPEMPVITGGAGALAVAHSDREFVDMNEVVRVAEFLARFALRQTGTE